MVSFMVVPMKEACGFWFNTWMGSADRDDDLRYFFEEYNLDK